MHQNIGYAQLGDGLYHLIAHAHARNVVNDVRPGGYGGAGGRCVHGVYADGDTGFGKPLDHGQDAPKFLINTDAHRTGPGGFAAYINNVCALRDHALRVGESVVRGVVFAAVAEGIGGDVQDSHHQGSLCGCGVAGQVCGRLRGHHCVHDLILTDARLTPSCREQVVFGPSRSENPTLSAKNNLLATRFNIA